MRVTVGMKLGFGFFVVVLLFFLVAANTFWASRHAEDSFRVLFERGSLDTERIAAIRLGMQLSHTALFQYVASVDPARRAALERRMGDLDVELRNQFDAVGASWDTPDERLDRLALTRQDWEAYHSVVESEILPMTRALARDEIYDLVVTRSQPCSIRRSRA